MSTSRPRREVRGFLRTEPSVAPLWSTPNNARGPGRYLPTEDLARSASSHGQACGSPCAKAADDVGCLVQAEASQAGCGQRGGVSLVAEDDPLDVVVEGLGDAGCTGRVQPPFQVNAFDDDRAGDVPVGSALELRPGVDEDCPTPHGVHGLVGFEPAQPGAGLGEDLVDPGHACMLPPCSIMRVLRPGESGGVSRTCAGRRRGRRRR